MPRTPNGENPVNSRTLQYRLCRWASINIPQGTSEQAPSPLVGEG